MADECEICGLTAGDLPDGVGFDDEHVVAEFFEGGQCPGCRPNATEEVEADPEPALRQMLDAIHFNCNEDCDQESHAYTRAESAIYNEVYGIALRVMAAQHRLRTTQPDGVDAEAAPALAELRRELWPCANYRAPLTCLTAPSTEAARCCDHCKAQVAEVRRGFHERIAQARRVLDQWEHDGPDDPAMHLLIRRVREALDGEETARG